MHILYGRKKWAKALEFGKKAEKIFETLGNREMLAAIYEIQALILMDQWEKPQDVNVLMQLMEIPQSIYEQAEPKTGNNPGILNEAMKLLQKTEKIYTQLDKKKELAHTWWYKGCVHIDQKEYPKGLKLLEKAILLFKELELPYEDYEKKMVDMKRSLPYAKKQPTGSL